MKKIVILTLCVGMLVFGSNALADELICGFAQPFYIDLYESDPGTDVPIAPCDVWFNFITENNQGPYTLNATAFGTQLNLALLKAVNFNETISMCVWLTILPPNQFDIRIRNVDFGGDDS